MRGGERGGKGGSAQRQAKEEVGVVGHGIMHEGMLLLAVLEEKHFSHAHIDIHDANKEFENFPPALLALHNTKV